MDIPMGERPAARVTRRSRNLSNNEDPPGSGIGEASSSRDHESASLPPILGDIVEKKRSKRKKKFVAGDVGITTNTTPAKYPAIASVARSEAFPSLKKPIGTYAKAGPPLIDQTAYKMAPSGPNERFFESSDLKTNVARDIQSMKAAASQDSDAMIAQMTPQQIHENQQELKNSLSPELRDLLLKRRETNRSRNKNTEGHIDTSKTTPIRSREEEIHFVSSIQTVEELDDAYERLVGKDGKTGLDPEDFSTACELLRSTVPRQTLWAVKRVRDRLREDRIVCQKNGVEFVEVDQWPYPVLLPVSLRCLLDTKPNKAISLDLHSYALESLLLLMKLRCPREYVDTVEGRLESMTMIYQNYFLDDVVPVRHPNEFFTTDSVTSLSTSSQADSAAYATRSSSKSASNDGELFVRDPMWTMLSKMRIIPRLDAILDYALPEKSLHIICQVLGLISMRNAGAAGAIAMHPTLVSKIWSQLTDRFDASSRIEAERCLLAVNLFCILARQTRSAAQALSLDAVMIRILAQPAQSESDYNLQRSVTVLFRCITQYGADIESTEQILTVSIERISFGGFWDRQLSKDLMLCCVNFMQTSYSEFINSFPDESAPFSEFRGTGLVLKAIQEILLFSFERDLRDSSTEKSETWSKLSVALRCLRELVWLLHREYLRLSKIPDWFSLSFESVRSYMEQVMGSSHLKMAFSLSIANVAENIPAEEASAASLAISFLSALDSLASYETETEGKNPRFSEIKDSFDQYLLRAVVQFSETVSSLMDIGFVRASWLGHARAHILGYIAGIRESNGLALVPFYVNVIGNLQLGQEATLLAVTRAFRLSEYVQLQRIQELLLRELHASTTRTQQLHHSTALGRTLIAANNKLLPESLLPFCTGIHSDPGDFFLPIGPLWVWRLLSGSSLGNREGHSDLAIELEAAQIIDAALVLLNTLEINLVDEDSGAKLYFMMNLALQPESIQVAISTSGEVLDRLTHMLLSSPSAKLVQSLMKSCSRHSGVSAQMNQLSSDMNTEERNLKLLIEGGMTSKDVRTLSDFASDISTRIIEFRDPSCFAVRFVRIFFITGLPLIVRVTTLKKLKGLLHLLSFGESDDRVVLESILGGGSAILRDSPRDEPELLDTLCQMYIDEPRAPEGFFRNFTLMALGKGLLIGTWEDSTRSQVSWKRRLENMPSELLGALAAVIEALRPNKEVTVAELVQVCQEKSSTSDVSLDTLFELLHC